MSSTSSSAGGGDAVLEAAVKKYQELRSKEQVLVQKISDLSMQEQEHRIVAETLKPMEAARRCYHMIGGVLCERTVADVLPQIESNRDGLLQLLKSLEETLKITNEERVHLQRKHGIRVVSKEEAARIAAQQQAAAASGSSSEGTGAVGGAGVGSSSGPGVLSY